MKYKKIDIKHILVKVEKPSRYINNELNTYHNFPKNDKANFCLAYPDLYEVGVSNLGLKILYKTLNDNSNATCDRVYLPWVDLNEILLEEKIPLFGLENKVPVKDYDVFGISIQAENTYTNVLYLLELSQIPIKRIDRKDSDPIVLAGGPAASNPLPLVNFIDAFFIGEAEEGINQIAKVILEEKDSTRKEKLKKLSELPGIFVPEIHGDKGKIKVQKNKNFHDFEYNYEDQIINWKESVHNRYVTEIMRGCNRGCRFCFAGYFYRPVRERAPKKLIKKIVMECLKNGWDEVSLLSLSSSDYTAIIPLLIELTNELQNKRINLALPSLRVDNLTDNLAKLMNSFQKSGLTVAPEAGSQRLRNIINKNITEEEIIQGVEFALKNNWKKIKLYFMIGLPFEQDSDIEAIVELVEKIFFLSKKRMRINITISPFIPKAFTPFQWAPFRGKDYLLEKAVYIKRALSKYKKINARYHEIEGSMLESVFSRGDEQVSDLIYQAYKNGAKFDGWTEFFDYSIWKKSADEIDLDIKKYFSEKSLDEELPWNFINLGLDESFLREEWKRSQNAVVTEDCRIGNCTNCGVCDSENQQIFTDSYEAKTIEMEKVDQNSETFYYRIFYEKIGDLKFVSHLDLQNMIHRFLRVSNLPLKYSQGYNPRVKVVMAPPLPVGVEGENEYFNVGLTKIVDIEKMESVLKICFPENLKFKKVVRLKTKAHRSQAYFTHSKLTIYPTADLFTRFEEISQKYNNSEEWFFEKETKRATYKRDFKKIILSLKWENDKLVIYKDLLKVNAFDIIEFIFGIERENTNKFRIVRNEFIHKK